jgi:hypothetical protein
MPNRPDFLCIDNTVSGKYIADLNKESGGRDIFLAYRKEIDGPPITELSVCGHIADDDDDDGESTCNYLCN